MLRTQGSWQLPLLEASALCLTEGETDHAVRLLAVDDEAYELARAELAGNEVRAASSTRVDAAVPGSASTSSEFEGVASDSSGRVFVLQEGAARILVFDGGLSALEGTITLSIPHDEPQFGGEWHADANSRGEGLLLLGNGHILVGKQREEPRIIEFGPSGNRAQGYTPGAALAPDMPFRFEGGGEVTFEPLTSWLVESGSGVKSVNDLACDKEGRLHFVSSKSRVIARIDGDLAPDAETAALTAWPLPGEVFETDDDKAEGLAFVPQLGWLVALDLERPAPNIFAIRREAR